MSPTQRRQRRMRIFLARAIDELEIARGCFACYPFVWC
jgi:hypothetical protein